jgi:hypothetical protein
VRTIVELGHFHWRHLVCILLALILPLSAVAQDSASAMLRSNGIGVLVNQNSAPASMALFRDDLIETQKKAVARIEISGSTADLSPETMVQFEGDELVLDHGSLSVNTNRGLRVRVGCVTVTPVKDADWTQYEVTDLNGKVTASALKSDVYIDSRSNKTRQAKQSTQSNREIVRETEQKSREEKCGAAYVRASVSTPGVGAILNSALARGVGLAAAGVLTCLGTFCHDDEPLSSSIP